MKKIYWFFLLPTLLCSLHGYAVTRMVTVSSNFFSPASFSANVGDVIQWNWAAGFHTTTSTSVPAGAATWNAPMNSGATTFSYTVTTAGTYNYLCNVHGAGMSGSFTVTALPLELGSFDGKKVGSSNWIFWETLTEKNVAFHIVERSADGKVWTELGRHPGSAGSTVPINYELEDTRPFSQTYYRLRSVDFDGRMAFSKVILLGEPFSLIYVFPNPTVDQVTIQFSTTLAESMRLSVVDITGKQVYNQVVETRQGPNTIVIPLDQMPVGIYNLLLMDERDLVTALQVIKK